MCRKIPQIKQNNLVHDVDRKQALLLRFKQIDYLVMSF